MAFVDPSKLLIWVHTWHGRDDLRGTTLRSLDASDAKGMYKIKRQPPGVDRDDFYMTTLREMCSDETVEWMLRIEDDAVVSKHIVHNVCCWSATQHELFGAGWLSVTSEMVRDASHVASHGGFLTREFPEAHFAGGVLMRTSFLAGVLPLVRRRLSLGEYRDSTPTEVRNVPRRFAPGCALSNAVWNSGRRVFFHSPSIVAIDMTIQTYHGKPSVQWDQPYNENWRA